MDTMLSRSGRSDPLGKLTRRLDVPVSEELEDAVIAMATLSGVGKAEYVRNLLERVIFGELTMVRRLAQNSMARQSDKYPINGGDTDE